MPQQSDINQNMYSKSATAYYKILALEYKAKQKQLKKIKELENNYNAQRISAAKKQVNDLFPIKTGQAKTVLKNNLASVLEDITVKSKSAKAAFSDFAQGIMQDMSRILAKKAAWAAVEGLFNLIPAAAGGVLPGQFTPITPMANGGLYNRPTLGLVAEAGTPEAVVPLKGGGIPVRFEDNKKQSAGATYIVNAFSEDFINQQVTKALSQNAELVLNMVQQDLYSQGSTYQVIRSIR